MATITPNIWCQRTADEAAALWTGAVPGSRVTGGSTFPHEGLLDFQKDFAGSTLTVDLSLAGREVTLINGGDEFAPNPSISMMLNFDPAFDDEAEAHLDECWQQLSDGGTVLMELGEYPFSPRYGWVQDRYGMSWQVILSDESGEPRPLTLPVFRFGGPAQNRAREAIDRWLDVFPDSSLGILAPYDEPMGPAVVDALMFSDFQLLGQWFVAMDSAVEQSFTFSEGVSMLVSCADQDEIDYYWSALSKVPEAEACGWCRDEFGVVWQIVPENMHEIAAKPGWWESLNSMKKIEIDRF